MSAPTDITGLLDLQMLREPLIPLEPEHFDQAIYLSQMAVNETHQWRTYINALALCGFVQWLQERATELPIQQDRCSVLQPQYASVLSAVCNLSVGGFNLCLITTESLADEWVVVPRAAVELPEFAAQLYVLLEVQEEQEQIVVRGCLRYDQLMQYQQTMDLLVQPDWTYLLPLDWFDADANHLLFYLRFLEPSTITRPVAPSRLVSTSDEALIAQLLLQSSRTSEVWEILSWEQGTALMTSPSLLDAFYAQLTRGKLTEIVSQPSATESAPSHQPWINVWNWSQNLLDAAAYKLSWSIPQPMTPAFAMRRSSDKIEAALHDLRQHQGIDIPHQAQYAYTTLQGTPFQLGTVTWVVASDQPELEWALLFILVAQPGHVLPPGTKLRVGNPATLAEVTLETMDLYLYVSVEGSQNEAFTPTIVPPDAAPIALPTFVYHPNSAP